MGCLRSSEAEKLEKDSVEKKKVQSYSRINNSISRSESSRLWLV